ncbi:MAG: hypothetical protein IPK83_11920 [Planctomycetes bacterium]|nr:hypothetical protein [Planctomycetota bacterium]
MATETFHPDRIIFSMEGSTAVYRDDIDAAIKALECVTAEQAEDLVATAGEDERAYGLRPRAAFLEAICKLIDEFLLDDDGGYYRMLVHLTRYERSAAALEVWFQVTKPGHEAGGTWIRRMVVGVDAAYVYSDILAAQ